MTNDQAITVLLFARDEQVMRNGRTVSRFAQDLVRTYCHNAGYEKKTLLSAKQWEWVHKIAAEYPEHHAAVGAQ